MSCAVAPRRWLAGGLLAISMAAGVAEAAEAAEAAELGTARLLLNAILINGQPAGEAMLLQLPDGRLYARGDDWRRWQLQIPPGAALIHERNDYYPLDQAQGYALEQDASTQTTALSVAAAAYAPSLRTLAAPLPQPPPAPRETGGFVNYDLVATRGQPDIGSDYDLLNAAIEPGLFGRWGVATSQWIGLDLAAGDRPSIAGSDGREIIRLDSSWRYDWPQQMQTLQFGDNIGKAGLWGRAARFGGLQWSRNFSTQPGFVSLPLPSVRGAAALPSTVDVYVDGIRRQSLDIPPGPFEIDSIPAINSLGEVQVVVRDLLGREQLLTQSYLSGARQLRGGLHDYAYEFGVQREDFGRSSNDYGGWLATGLHRYGFNDALTGEARLELRGGGGQTAGLGAIAAVPHVGVVSLAAAFSHDDAGDGRLGLLAWQRVVRRSLSLGARAQFASRDFTQTGVEGDLATPARLLTANAGIALTSRFNFGLGYIGQRYRDDRSDIEAGTATLSVRFGLAALALQALRRFDESEDLSLGLTFSMPLGSRLSAGAGYRNSSSVDGRDRHEARASLQRNPGTGEGYGYRVAVLGDDREGDDREGDDEDGTLGAEAGVSLNAAYGSYVLEAATDNAGQTYRASLAGALAAYAGEVFASRPIYDGFAVVNTGVGDVPLRLNSQLVARSNDAGIAIIPELQAYQQNQLRIDADSLPIDVEIDTAEADVMPYYRSGTQVRFLLRLTQGALIRLLHADGRPVLPGAWVQFGESGDRFAVGREGRAYVSGLRTGSNNATLVDDGKRCTIRIELPANAGPQPELGPILCQPTP